MITIRKPIDLSVSYPLERIGALEELLFFDIETTGFSGDHANLYLIGCAYHEGGNWNLIQWFADHAGDEELVLQSFFDFLRPYRTLIHFNGDSFDLPFLQKRCRHLGLACDFSRIGSLDIYHKIKPYKKLLQLDSLKQKSIERFLGVRRDDLFFGGQLIEVYQDYLTTRDEALYRLLILHNEDDLKGMPSILPILSYPDLLEQPLELLGHRIFQRTDLFGAPQPFLEITCQSGVHVPVPVEYERTPVAVELRGGQATFTVELYQGTLKHFYPNYKDYYYLIHEDEAIHKSVGEYVDKAARSKATAQNCYTKKEGCFLPQFSPLWEPVLQKAPKDRTTYADMADVCLEDGGYAPAYLRQLLLHLGLIPGKSVQKGQ